MNRTWFEGCRWIDLWHRYWFEQTTAVRISMCRMIMVFCQLTWFRPELSKQLHLIRHNEKMIDPQVLIRAVTAVVPADQFRSEACMTGMFWLMMVTGVMSLIGILTRPALFIFAILNWVFVAHHYSYGEKHHSEAIFCIVLLLMALAPSGRCLSVDGWLGNLFGSSISAGGWGIQPRFTTAMWPLRTGMWLLALSYLCAGLCKLHQGGFAWLEGATLQGYLLADGVRWDRPVGVWLSQQAFLCTILSIGTILFELGFFLTIMVRKLAPYILLIGVAIHVGIFVTQAAGFWQFIVLYVIWVPFDKMLLFVGKTVVRTE